MITDKDFKELFKYKTIKTLFVRLNTAISSSAPVERMFSSAGQIETSRRNCLGDSVLRSCSSLKLKVLFEELARALQN